MIITRKTLQKECQFVGKGLHSGEPVTVDVFPSEDGIQFQHGSDVFDAIPSNVADTSRCTVIGSIRTVEHIMSSLAALAITDARIELSYPEMPGLDGSALPYWQALSQCGSEEIGTRELNDIYTRLYVQAEAVKVAVGKGTGHWRFDFETNDGQWPGSMSFGTEHVSADYAAEIAPARTTVFANEIEIVKAAGLGKGLDESSVLIIGEADYENAARFEDEPPRHKLLDLIGDLYLAGIPIEEVNVVGTRSGHRRNVEMANLLFESTRIQ